MCFFVPAHRGHLERRARSYINSAERLQPRAAPRCWHQRRCPWCRRQQGAYGGRDMAAEPVGCARRRECGRCWQGCTRRLETSLNNSCLLSAVTPEVFRADAANPASATPCTETRRLLVDVVVRANDAGVGCEQRAQSCSSLPTTVHILVSRTPIHFYNSCGSCSGRHGRGHLASWRESMIG